MDIQHSVSLRDKNWFRTGGEATFFAAPHTTQELLTCFDWATTHTCPTHILGLGANTLISDSGFKGLIIRPAMATIGYTDGTSMGDVFVQAGAGVSIATLIAECLNNNIIGLEEFSGIPGTVGGSVYNNLHYYDFSLADFVHSAEVIDCTTGLLEAVDKAWLALGYDSSRLHQKQHVLVSATFLLKRVSPLDAAYARGRHVEIIRHRAKRYPVINTCGCFLRNFTDQEIARMTDQKKLRFVAYYLDQAGVKGVLQHGGATVSHQHANMIVTNTAATSADIIAVARRMQELVYKQCGMVPTPECELVGFEQYPLYTQNSIEQDMTSRHQR